MLGVIWDLALPIVVGGSLSPSSPAKQFQWLAWLPSLNSLPCWRPRGVCKRTKCVQFWACQVYLLYSKGMLKQSSLSFVFFSILLWTITKQWTWDSTNLIVCSRKFSLDGCGGTHTHSPSAGRRGQDNSKFEVSLSYTDTLTLSQKERKKSLPSMKKAEYE